MRRFLAASTATLALTGVLATVAAAAPATSFRVDARPFSGIAGDSVTFDVKAVDDVNLLDPSYDGVVSIHTGDAAATVPSSVTLTDGVGSFVATPRTVGWGSWTVDLHAGALSGSGWIGLNAGPPASVALYAPPLLDASSVPGQPAFFDAMVTVYDALGNIRDGTLVSLSAGDPLAVVPPPKVVTRDAPVVGTVFLYSLGSQSVTATVVNDPALTDTRTVVVYATGGGGGGGGGGSSTPLTVDPAPVAPQPASLGPVVTTTPAQAALACSRIPTLTGQRFDAAKRILQRDGCNAISVTRTGPLRRKGRPTHVRAQSPLPGTPLAQGATVTLRLGR